MKALKKHRIHRIKTYKDKRADIVVEAVLGILLGVLVILFLIKGVIPRFLGVSDYNKYVDRIADAVSEAGNKNNIRGSASSIVKLPKKSAILVFSSDQKNLSLIYSEVKEGTTIGDLAAQPKTIAAMTILAGILVGVGAVILTISSGGLTLVTIGAAAQAFITGFIVGSVGYFSISYLTSEGYHMVAFELKDLLKLDTTKILAFEKPSICGESACVCLCNNIKLKDVGDQELTYGDNQNNIKITANAEKAVCGQVYCRSLGNNMFLTNLGTIEYYNNMVNTYGGSSTTKKYLKKKVKVAYTGLFPLKGYVLENKLTDMPNPDTRVLYFERILNVGGSDSKTIYGVCEYPPCVNKLTKEMLLIPDSLMIIAQELDACNNANADDIIPTILNLFPDLPKEQGSFSLAFHKLSSKDKKDLEDALKQSGNDKGSEDTDSRLHWLEESSSVVMFFYRPPKNDNIFRRFWKSIVGGRDIYQIVAIQPLPDVNKIVLKKKELGGYSEFSDFEIVKEQVNNKEVLKVTHAYDNGKKQDLNFPLRDVYITSYDNQGNANNKCDIEFYMDQTQ